MLSKSHSLNIQKSKEKVVKHLIIYKDNFTSSIQTGAARVHDNIRTIISISNYLSIFLFTYLHPDWCCPR